MTSKWDCATTTKFIQEYRRHECLWNFDSPNYRNTQLRDLAYLNIANTMSLPDVGIQEVKNKIKNLRSTYNQEMKKIEDSKKQISGVKVRQIYESNIKWLKELTPFYMSNEKRKASADKVAKKQDESMIQDFQEEVNNRNKTAMKQTHVLKEPSVKRKKSMDSGPANHFKRANNHRDASDVFGECVSLQLKNMTKERALLAKCKIQEILTEYGIADLKERKAGSSSYNDFSLPSVTPDNTMLKQSPNYDVYESTSSPTAEKTSEDPLAESHSPYYQFNAQLQSPHESYAVYESSDNKDALATVVSKTFSDQELQEQNNILG